jgi:hypothetical protein
MTFTPRQRIRAALQGEMVDAVRFTIYARMLHRGEAERRLRAAGLTPVERLYIYRIEMPHVVMTTRECYEEGLRTLYETVRTPVGQVNAVKKIDPSYGSTWNVQFYIKRPEDYAVAQFMVQDSVYVPTADEYQLAQERWGEDGYVFASTGYSPMNYMIYRLLGVERFGIDLHEHPDLVLGLYEAIREKQRDMFRLCAASPAELIQYGGNVHQDVVGPRRFVQYYIPCFNEFADAVHSAGKMALCHMDAPMRSLAPALAQTRIDVIEAFTPAPCGDMTVREARQAWPDQVLWINFPSAMHLEEPDVVCNCTRQIIDEAAPGDRFLLGITEDIPEHRWRTSLNAIAHTIAAHGSLPLAAHGTGCDESRAEER